MNKKLSIIDGESDEYSIDTRLLIEAAKARNIDAEVVDFRQLNLNKLEASLGDWIFTRRAAESRSTVLMAGRSYLASKIIMNSAIFCSPGSSNKLYQQLMFANCPELSEYSIPTYKVDSRRDLDRLITANKLTLPIIIKPDNGVEGVGVRVIRDTKEMDEIGKWYGKVAQPFIMPESEWRIYAMGGVSLSAGRNSSDRIGDRSRPGAVDYITETDQNTMKILSQISLMAASWLGLEYSGVDILRDKKTGKYHIIEANVLAGIAMPRFSASTKENLPGEVVNWFIDRDKLINQKLPLEQCLSDYMKSRLHRLPAEVQKRVKDILDCSESPRKSVTESRIIEIFSGIKLEDKLKFLYDELNQGNSVPQIANIILSEAEKFMSWAGNFLVDQNVQPYNKPSVMHTLENGAISSAYFIACKKMLSSK